MIDENAEKGWESLWKERNKEIKEVLLLVFDKYKKESLGTRGDNSTKSVNGSPITIQKTDKNTEQKSMDEKVRKIILYDKK